MIDKDEAIRLLRKEVANKGEDFVYRSPVTPWKEPGQSNCVYFYEGQPSCIVGHAIDHILDDETKRTIDDPMEDGSYYSPSANSLNVDEISSEAGDIFSAAQSLQDSGCTWGEALKNAERVYRELGGSE